LASIPAVVVACTKHAFFFEFSLCLVCPEPVLVNVRFYIHFKKRLKKGRFSHRACRRGSFRTDLSPSEQRAHSR
jgi:hypothetical protein